MTEFSGMDLTCIRGERLVFTELSFSIKKGQILHLKGPNGSGKSTLLRLMAGLIRPTKGVVLWKKENILSEPELFHRALHYVSHQDAVKAALTVEENLTFWAKMGNVDKEERFVDEALIKFSLNHLASLPTRFLSAGQCKRLNLSRICATKAPLWLLDEPSNSLDSESLDILNEVILAHQRAGGLTAIATHDDLGLNCNSLDVSMFHDVQSVG